MITAFKNRLSRHFILVLTLGVTLIIYIRFVSFGHISWDDPEMVFRNKAVQHFDLRSLLSHHFVGNYIPLTMLVHAIAWQLFGNHDGWHHLLILLIHLLNGVLVYLAGRRLFKNEFIASLGCIIFLLHPLQMESVGWISELKNVLSSAFYLGGILKYLDYVASAKKKDYALMLLYFILGCLSKSSVVVFPLALLCLDLIIYKGISYRFVLNKLPLLPLSLLFGFINLKTQAADLFINYAHAFPYYQRIGYAGYAILKYLLLFFMPVDLSVIYPYPQHVNAALVTGYAALVVMGALLFWTFLKKKYTVAGLLLFTGVNLVLVLQLVPFGEVLYADRYMYLPIIGFGWLSSVLLYRLRAPLRPVAFTLMALLGIASFFRGHVWQSAITLYEDILKKFPNSFVALNSVGVEYMFSNDHEKAFYYLDKSIRVAPYNYKGFYNRGLLYLKNQQPELAVADFDKALQIYNYPKAYLGRASAYQLLGDLPKAMNDAQLVLNQEPKSAKAHFVLGNCYNDMNRLPEALQEYNLCIQLNGDDAEFYFRRGIVYGKEQNFSASVTDISRCLELNPSYYEAYYWRGVAKINLKQDACADFRISAQKNYRPAVNAYSKYCR